MAEAGLQHGGARCRGIAARRHDYRDRRIYCSAASRSRRRRRGDQSDGRGARSACPPGGACRPHVTHRSRLFHRSPRRGARRRSYPCRTRARTAYPYRRILATPAVAPRHPRERQFGPPRNRFLIHFPASCSKRSAGAVRRRQSMQPCRKQPMDDLLSEFLTETNESVSMLDVELVKLEQNPNDPALLSNIFRLVHTIKGTCGFLGLPRLESVAHAAENVLGKVRDGELTVSPVAVSLILESLDCIKMIMGALEATEAEPAGDDSHLIARLNLLAGDEAAPQITQPTQTVGAVQQAESGHLPNRAAPVASPLPGEMTEAVPPNEAGDDVVPDAAVEVSGATSRQVEAGKESVGAGKSIRVKGVL